MCFSGMLSLGRYFHCRAAGRCWSLYQGHMCEGRDRFLAAGAFGHLVPCLRVPHIALKVSWHLCRQQDTCFVQKFWNLEPRTLHFLAQSSPLQIELPPPPPLCFCHVTFLTHAFLSCRRLTPDFFQGCSVEETQLHSLQLHPLFTSQCSSTRCNNKALSFFLLSFLSYLGQRIKMFWFSVSR